jgi:putative peptidoglycan lipid II flippase
MVVTCVMVPLCIVLNFLLIGPFKHTGLALSSSIVLTSGAVILLFLLRKKLGTLNLRSAFGELSKAVVGVTVMGIVVWLGYSMLPVMSGGTVQCIALTATLAFCGAAVYALMHLIMRSEFKNDAITHITGLIKRGI